MSLAKALLAEGKRPSLVQACVSVVDEEVRSKSGLGGLAIKTAFKTVKAFKPGIIPDVVDALLDDFVDRLEPFYAEFQDGDDGGFGAYTVKNADRVADALLSITDARADKSKHKTLVKAYRRLRPQGKKQVVIAMPRIGRMLEQRGLKHD